MRDILLIFVLLEMEPGSALIFLASCYHGGGHNSTKDEVREGARSVFHQRQPAHRGEPVPGGTEEQGAHDECEDAFTARVQETLNCSGRRGER